MKSRAVDTLCVLQHRLSHCLDHNQAEFNYPQNGIIPLCPRERAVKIQAMTDTGRTREETDMV